MKYTVYSSDFVHKVLIVPIVMYICGKVGAGLLRRGGSSRFRL